MYQSSIRNKKKISKFNNSKHSDYSPEIDEEYAIVTKMLGNCRVNLTTNEGNDILGIIRGSLRKFTNKIFIELGDIVVVSVREFQKSKADIVHKYNRDQTLLLISEDKLSNIILNIYNKHNTSSNSNNCNIEFELNQYEYDSLSDINSSNEEDNEDIEDIDI
tara:strand:+ start:182 stop:667 length:486 start_codon:yes stop_codon:yes gene_type:complete